MNQNMDERLLDLLCDKATGSLSEDEARELAELSASANTDMNAQSLELAAAAILLAETEIEQMPSHLEAKLLKVAQHHFAARDASLDGAVEQRPIRAIQFSEPKPSRSFFDWFGWAVAAAACIALAGTVYYNQQRITTLQAQVEELRRPSPAPVQPTVAQQRDQLIREAGDITRAAWTKGPQGAEGVTGEVVWSDEKQMGYMTFRGLPANDPNREAYQLWIFENAQLEAHPKDGGVFNVSETGEVIVPIEAKLKVNDPKVFAITVEKPGGVVVSGREKIAALAPVKPSQT